MKRSIFYTTSGLFVLCGWLTLNACSQPNVCNESVSVGSLSINPQGSPCTYKCECNNQLYEGFCKDDGSCQSLPRESCRVPGKKRACIPLKLDDSGCKDGIQICQPPELGGRSLWGDCKPLVPTKESGKELCQDGLDNDCDGKTDLGDPECKDICNPGKVEPCFDNEDKTLQGIGICKQGVRVCKEDATWGTCEGQQLPQQEVCDGQDNDCNGKIDELDECKCWPPAKKETCYSGDSATKDKGVCQSGERTCQLDGTWGECVGEVTPQPERCNGQDDDCNGRVDDGGQCQCWPPLKKETCYSGDSATKDKGVCQAGERTCGGDGIWGACVGEVTPQPETCNGKDDDCNGKVDDDSKCQCWPPLTQAFCYSGPQAAEGIGSCKRGIHTCLPDGTWSRCEGEVIPQSEVCDGKDNDCNGKVDELAECECWPPSRTESCYTAPSPTQNVGICTAGVRTCQANGKWGVCLGQQTPQAEECNLKDDDCDGQIDNTPGGSLNSLIRNCYTGQSGCTLRSGVYTCVGHCKVGTQRCANGSWGPCQGESVAQAEECNGKDDDCDGQIDEDADLINAPLCLKQRGDCKGATTPTRLCQNGRWLPCDDNTYKAHFSAYNRTESCDKKDNDCNGQIDEHIKGCLSIIAGGGPKGASDGFGTEAEFNIPQGLLLKDGNIYVSDTNNHQIRKIDPCGNVTTIAGSGVRGFKDGPPLQAELHSPRELLAYKGDILIADAYNHRIRRLSGNTLTTFLGGPQQGLKDGPIGQATTQDPRTLYLASSQHIYFVDSKRNTIRFVHNETTVGSTLINSLPSLFRPVDFFETSSGELYVINDDYAVYKLLPGGTLQQPEKTVVHVAGVVKDKQVGTAQDGNVASVEFRYPEGITIDNNGVLYIADTGRNRIRTIENGQVKTILTSANGPINEPVKLDFDGDGNLFILVKSSNRVLKWNINNTSQRTTTCIDVWAGLPNKESTPPKGLRNGYRLQALFNNPYMMLFAKSGEAFISDTSNYRIRKIDITGKLSDLAGGVYGFKDDFQSQASFKHPAGIALDKQGNLYVADSENHRIRKIDASGNVTTFAGTGLAGYKDGTGNVAQFDTPVGLAFDDVGDLYVIGNNKRIRTIDPSGNVSTFAGGGSSLEGARQNISITAPKHLLFGPDRALYFSDGHRIRKIDTSGNVTTFAGTGTAGYKDGSGKTAQLNEPFGMAFGPFGSLFVADRGNRRIRKISPTGVVTTIAGGTKGFGVGGVASPSGANIPFYTPTHLTFDPRGNLYITDTESQRVFKMTFEW